MGLSMAEAAGKACMFAGVVNQLLFRARVAGDTDLPVFADHADIQRLMGVMASEARVCDFVMSIARMAVTAGRNVVLRLRAMPLMAFQAIDFSLMGATLGRNLRRFLAMTFDTVLD